MRRLVRIGLLCLIPIAGLAAPASADALIPNPCGNNFVDPGEQCDDGNVISGDGCSAICQLEADAGANPDTGVMDPIPTDGGIDNDAGGVAPMDASNPTDSGGAPFDSGGSNDVGFTDVGFNDVGSASDAGSDADAQSPADSGRPDSMLQVFMPPPVASVDEAGCGCTTSRSERGSVAGLALLLGLFLRRRR